MRLYGMKDETLLVSFFEPLIRVMCTFMYITFRLLNYITKILYILLGILM